MLYAGHIKFKLSAAALQLFTHAAFQLIIHKMASSECIHLEAKKMEVGGC
jgi:hypothetical protein